MAMTATRRGERAIPGRDDDVGRRGPRRRCIVSGEVRDKADLLRFVRAPDGSLVPDPAGRLPGRGLWLSARRDMIERACARNLFARAARAQVRVPEDLLEQLERSLKQRCLDLIGLARRAGQAVAGYEKVRARLASGRAGVVIQAADAAAGGRHKIAALARARHPDLPIVELFGAEELGRALGRGSTVHVVLDRGPLAGRLLGEIARLSAVAGGEVEGVNAGGVND
jgi:predicted RNA-binding protein YlxR (DUF448 family)